MTGYDELSQFDQTFTPQSGIRPGIDSLPDGDYDCEIITADIGRTEKTNELILRLGLRTNVGAVVEYAYFFRTQQSVDILGGDLVTLGFDADQWKPPARPFSTELPRVVPMLVGLRFRARKKTAQNQKDPSKPFHNLYVNQRLNTSAAPSGYVPTSAPTQASADSDPIPF